MLPALNPALDPAAPFDSNKQAFEVVVHDWKQQPPRKTRKPRRRFEGSFLPDAAALRFLFYLIVQKDLPQNSRGVFQTQLPGGAFFDDVPRTLHAEQRP